MISTLLEQGVEAQRTVMHENIAPGLKSDREELIAELKATLK